MRILKFIFGVSFVYFMVSILSIINGFPVEFVQIIYVLTLSIPLWNKWVADKLKFKRFWD